MTSDLAPELKVWTDKRGRTRVSWPGRKGYPVTVRKDESPEQAYMRAAAADALQRGPAADESAGATGAGQNAAGVSAGPSSAPTADEPRARPRGSDPKPRTRPAGKARPTTAELARVLEELLSLPAIPMGMPVRDESRDVYVDPPEPGMAPTLIPGFRPRCEFCRDHFIQAGPPTAQELAKLSERSEPLRRFFEQIHLAWSSAGVIAVIANYAAKPLLHHLAPEQALSAVGPAIGVPPRPPAAPAHDHHPRHAAASAGASPTAA